MRAMSISKGGEAYERLKMVRELVLLPVFFFSYITPSYKKAWFKRMSEAIISRRGWGESGKPKPSVLKSDLIVENTIYQIPTNIANNLFSIRIFGGGGGGGGAASTPTNVPHFSLEGGGGGGGWMNNAVIDLSSYVNIPITIGSGGLGTRSGNPTAGGTSSFGTLLSANGGSPGKRASTSSSSNSAGGDGGSGGGATLWGSARYGISSSDGGKGYQFGGGGGSRGGDGGVYGGGGGGMIVHYQINNNANGKTVNRFTLFNGGIGGSYGGNGGSGLYGEITNGNISLLNGNNGTNTIGIENEFSGPGNGSVGVITGGFNLGGPAINNYIYGGFGAGGGYGGCGGQTSTFAGILTCWANITGDRAMIRSRSYGAGGGGGYGSNGGNGYDIYCGGGGGYGGKGGDAVDGQSGGGGGYGNGGSGNDPAGYGGGGATFCDGGKGICIIQYYI